MRELEFWLEKHLQAVSSSSEVKLELLAGSSLAAAEVVWPPLSLQCGEKGLSREIRMQILSGFVCKVRAPTEQPSGLDPEPQSRQKVGTWPCTLLFQLFSKQLQSVGTYYKG